MGGTRVTCVHYRNDAIPERSHIAPPSNVEYNVIVFGVGRWRLARNLAAADRALCALPTRSAVAAAVHSTD